MKRGGSRKHGDLIASVDIGGAKVACAIASLVKVPGGGFEPDIVGIGQYGLARDTGGREREEAMRASIHAAERMAGADITSAALVAPGRAIASKRVAIDLPLAGGLVTVEDVDECLNEAASMVERGRRLIAARPIRYSLDGQIEQTAPIGQAGDRFTLEALVLDARETAIVNMEAALMRAGVAVDAVIPRPKAAAAAVLVEDEMDLGALAVDFGSKSTDFAVFERGALVACGGVAIGADSITRDIAQIFGASLAECERVKTLQGCAFASPDDQHRLIDFPQLGDPSEVTRHSRAELAGVIAPRLEEILELTMRAAERAGAKTDDMRRVVVTGGGALLLGLVETIERVVGARARLGRPSDFLAAPEAAAAPQFAAALGGLKILAAGDAAPRLGWPSFRYVSSAQPRRAVGGARGVLSGVGYWLRENF
ncbi:MAG: cell division protein FtsA [Pseudomonadota bacterium]